MAKRRIFGAERTPLDPRVLRPADQRRLDQHAIQELGMGAALMETAGGATARTIVDRLAGRGCSVLILSGRGNNGGDGLVAARFLASFGVETTVALVLGEPTTSAALHNLRLLSDSAVSVLVRPSMNTLREALLGAGVLVDAILGTGVSGTLREEVGEVLACIHVARREHHEVLALDIPTGICASTGQRLGDPMSADLTLAFGHLKPGLLTYPGRRFCGDVAVVPLGYPQSSYEALLLAHQASEEPSLHPFGKLGRLPEKRDEAGHKGTFGHVLVVGGAPNMGGAAILCARAALRSGAGRVTLMSNPQACRAAISQEPALMTIAIDFDATPEQLEAWLTSKMKPNLDHYDTVVLGCGLGRTDAARAIAHAVLDGCDGPLIVDADALHFVARRDVGLPPGAILTPHPKELAELLGMSVGEVKTDLLSASFASSRRYRCQTVAKDATTFVTGSDGGWGVVPGGNPLLATAGSGDVLSGMIGSLVSSGGGVTAHEPTTDDDEQGGAKAKLKQILAAVRLHQESAKMARDRGQDRGFTAIELILAIR